MNREIKFRAWDKINNKMCPIAGISFTNKDTWLRINDKQIMGANFSEIEIMQYAGLKDKNDKEIYEGDIINIINNSVDEEDGYFIAKYDIETARYILSGNGLVYDFDNTYTNECEIIGNIYENPELLKEV